MIICKVVGHVWATKKEQNLEGTKLMVVEQTDTHGEQNNALPYNNRIKAAFLNKAFLKFFPCFQRQGRDK